MMKTINDDLLGGFFMNYWKMLLASFLLVFSINLLTVGSNYASADDDYDEKYEQYEDDKNYSEGEEDEGLEDIGETVGWGTVVAMGVAGLIFPLRRVMKKIITNYPVLKNSFIAISKFLGKNHVLIGIFALVLSGVHGVLMYLSEGQLESEGIIGLAAAVLMVVAGIFGAILLKNKKVKSYRLTHTLLIAFAFLFGLVHIFTS